MEFLKKKPKIVVVGSTNVDLVVKLKRLPQPGETVTEGKFFKAFGGKGANQAVTVARLGGEVVFITRVGKDPFGSACLENLKEHGVDISFITQDEEEATGVALILVGENGENMIGVAPGANHKLSTEEVEKARSVIKEADAVLLQLEIPLETVERVVEIAYSEGVPVILNPAPFREIKDEVLKRVTFLTPNEKEASSLTGIENLVEVERMGEVLLEKGIKNVIITLGEKGALLVNEKGKRRFPTLKVDAVDTTAAGDVFNGALAFALGSGKSLEEAIIFANCAAAISTTRMGAQPSIPDLKSVLKSQENYSR